MSLRGSWPEGLFIFVVMYVPFVVASVMWRSTFLGFLGLLALGMAIGVVVWFGCVWIASSLYDRADASQGDDID